MKAEAAKRVHQEMRSEWIGPMTLIGGLRISRARYAVIEGRM